MSSGQYADVNGQHVYYEVHGAGRPLVMLHGGVLTLDMTFGGLIEPLVAAGRQVIGVELQGHGHTPDSDRPYALADLADDVAALVRHLGLPQVDLFGFSLGGLTATQLLVAHPDLVGRAVLASSHFRRAGYHDWVFEVPPDPAGPFADRLPSEADFEEMRVAYEAVAPDPAHFFEFLAKPGGMVASFDGWADEVLRAIQAPTLLVIGDRDFVRLEHAVAMLDVLPDAQLAVLPATTHIGVMRSVDRLLPLVLPFLA